MAAFCRYVVEHRRPSELNARDLSPEPQLQPSAAHGAASEGATAAAAAAGGTPQPAGATAAKPGRIEAGAFSDAGAQVSRSRRCRNIGGCFRTLDFHG